MIKPSVPKGTRDFSPNTVKKRIYILETISAVFRTFGFEPLETPAMENLSTLTGKYGEEGDQLMFRILDNGDIYRKIKDVHDTHSLAAAISEKALRYDLTIPFARYVVMHQNDIAFPFKRYQIQPVWRADKPQKGRYREFYQCDADIVGSDSLLNELELLKIYDTVFQKLRVTGYQIHINNRKLLAGLAESLGKEEQLTDITIAIDKLDKIGLKGVKEELSQRGLLETEINKIQNYLAISGTNSEKLRQLEALLPTSEAAQKGILELRQLVESSLANFSQPLLLNPTLARGLNYYTGTIIEVKAPSEVKIGSIGGGGRYDNLTGLFGKEGLSGVGISFGVDRIYDVLEELHLFPDTSLQSTSVLFLQIEEKALADIFDLIHLLRSKGISSEIYPDPIKFGKQMKYANKRNIPFVAIMGEAERTAHQVSIKNMQTGEQEQVPIKEVFSYLERLLH